VVFAAAIGAPRGRRRLDGARRGLSHNQIIIFMKTVFVHHDPTMVGHKKSILEEAGIDCFIRNENTSATFGGGALGLVQSPVFDPALCIVDDSRYDEAVALLKTTAEPSLAGRADWRCSKCGESVPGNFETCWNCSNNGHESAS